MPTIQIDVFINCIDQQFVINVVRVVLVGREAKVRKKCIILLLIIKKALQMGMDESYYVADFATKIR